MKSDYDVMIVGGGLAGLTTACLLGQAGMKVACIERSAPDNTSHKDLRTTAISFGSRQVLERAGIWPALEGEACPIKTIKILDGGGPVLLDFLHEEVEGRDFGWIVENTALRRGMMVRVLDLQNVTHIAPRSVKDFIREEDKISATLDNGEQLSAALVIGADGRGSFTREWMNVPVKTWSYGQTAIICTIAHQNPHNNVAVEDFRSEGPFAILPMCDDDKGRHRSSIVFTEHKPSRRSLTDTGHIDFECILTERMPGFYGDIALLNERRAYPLNLVHAMNYIAPRMVLIADAAHGIHPIAGQGLNLGFRDIDTLASLLQTAFDKGEDLGSRHILEEYQRRRRPDNMAMVAFTDTLNRLFSNDFPPVRLLRRAGLRLVSRARPVSKFFMRKAMGA